MVSSSWPHLTYVGGDPHHTTVLVLRRTPILSVPPSRSTSWCTICHSCLRQVQPPQFSSLLCAWCIPVSTSCPSIRHKQSLLLMNAYVCLLSHRSSYMPLTGGAAVLNGLLTLSSEPDVSTDRCCRRFLTPGRVVLDQDLNASTCSISWDGSQASTMAAPPVSDPQGVRSSGSCQHSHSPVLAQAPIGEQACTGRIGSRRRHKLDLRRQSSPTPANTSRSAQSGLLLLQLSGTFCGWNHVGSKPGSPL